MTTCDSIHRLSTSRIRPQGRILAGGIGCLLLISLAAPAAALLRIDFEQKYLIHPGRQTWDFCLVRPDSVYHAFYHSIHETTPSAAFGDTIWHATSPDLKHWLVVDPVLTVGPDWWDAGAMWAPEVFWDPVRELWAMLYTGVDQDMNQRACLAFSPDLYDWFKDGANPVFAPDPQIYHWDPAGNWSSFRDPFVFREGEIWHMLNTASIRVAGGGADGIIHHAVSLDLQLWEDAGVFFRNDGAAPHHVLESTQYKVRDGIHHLYFGEYNVYGISHLAAADTAAWTMADRSIIDYGNAPVVERFDAAIDIFSRITAYQDSSTDLISYCVRFDTLRYYNDGMLPDPYQPHPMAESFATWSGSSCLAQPTFGDNSAIRGEDPAGTVGHGYYGSAEYYQGPLSGRGQPGTSIGDVATGVAQSYPFYVVGESMSLHVGGGDDPEHCYVALVDAEIDSVLLRETGAGVETMTQRYWDLRPYLGRLCYIAIVDSSGAAMGHINVDEIIELEFLPTTATGPVAAPRLVDHGPSPNPFNPATTLRFSLPRAGSVRVRVHDLAGRVIWSSSEIDGRAGANSLRWDGRDQTRRELPSGVYLYTIEFEGRLAASGKLALLK